MGDLYRSSSWGLDLNAKSAELSHEKARFLVVTEERDTHRRRTANCCQQTQPEEGRDDVVAFCHFRFEPDNEYHPTEEILYLYEIQVRASSRGYGLGRRLMTILEHVAMRSGMRRVVLTVFRNNVSAMNFYIKKMSYAVDASSPSNFPKKDGDAEYEILSKSVCHRDD
eukprot:CAMPEP_0172507346 /NCGR_PEP_ID=MMETSP1066-20121228/203012_1 /TAXON_ID=671091 /ORGANISM="Coscinodiscus wailesii, Strain CCMP2513" /LENGTH=167 /DNA_ID=CAMNT_0013284869 /DNA_START=380 /DNA_END=883 /DNA_ORIENTATION=-